MIRTVISLVCLLAAGAVFFMYTQPTYDTVQAENAQIAQYDEALTKASELQQLKQSLLSRYNTFDPLAIAAIASIPSALGSRISHFRPTSLAIFLAYSAK